MGATHIELDTVHAVGGAGGTIENMSGDMPLLATVSPWVDDIPTWRSPASIDVGETLITAPAEPAAHDRLAVSKSLGPCGPRASSVPA
jgi:hypothetical protein